MKKYYKVHICLKEGYTNIEVARFTSKGMMALCLPTIQNTYTNTEYQVIFDRD